ncbi:MAG TPA: dCTP deaminase [Allosphingosinicella sp.]
MITSALKLLFWDTPRTSEEDGAVHQAERRFLDYILEDDGNSWLTVYPDHILKGILREIERVFEPHAGIAYQSVRPEVLVRLVGRLALARPPIVEDIDEEGRATQQVVSVQHCLYAGWTAWLGRDPLREASLGEHPRLKTLTFLEVNRLCAQAILQQRAIDTVAEWHRKHPLKEEEPVAISAAPVGKAASGALGRSAIIDRIGSGNLIVSPLLAPDQIGASSIDLRMGNVVLIARARGSASVDPREAMRKARKSGHDKEAGSQQKHERYELKFKTPFLLHPGTLALVPTLEWISLPDDLMGSVTARSTWAREGLSIATATMIEPGYQGIVTLELANLGEIPIAVYPGIELAQISFFDVVGNTGRLRRGQFELSFEPQGGNVAKRTEYPFLSDDA